MRHAPIVRAERFRIHAGPMASTAALGNNGAFQIPCGRETFCVVVSEGDGQTIPWEHVSVSLPHRCPTWEEMVFFKHLFFGDDEVAVQFHPAKRDYVNYHPYCLHLWRWTGGEFPVPDPVLVGPLAEGVGHD